MLALNAHSGGRLIGELSWRLGRAPQNAARWPTTFTREFPRRARRLGGTLRHTPASLASRWTDVQGAAQAAQALEQRNLAGAGRALVAWLSPGALWVVVLGAQVFDLAGGPEIVEVALRALTHTSPLQPAERAAAAEMLGQAAERWDEVQIAEGGLLRLIFKVNGNRAFTTWHTVNLPLDGQHTRDHLDIVIHELVHVYQYEQVGSAYLVEALYAQLTSGYGYGQAAGLLQAAGIGRAYANYNREQQAQIVQDYFVLCRRQAGAQSAEELKQCGDDIACYTPFITEMRAGRV